MSARTRDDPVPCPLCGQLTGRVHGFHGRVVADVPVDGRRVVASVRVRRLVCLVLGCPRQTFREQVPGVVERYQRRTSRLADQLGCVVTELAGRAGARLSRVLACTISRSTALRMLMHRAAPPLRRPRRRSALPPGSRHSLVELGVVLPPSRSSGPAPRRPASGQWPTPSILARPRPARPGYGWPPPATRPPDGEHPAHAVQQSDHRRHPRPPQQRRHDKSSLPPDRRPYAPAAKTQSSRPEDNSF